MSKTLSLAEVKTHFPTIIAGIQQREEEVVVTRNGKPAAVLLSYDEYARLKATLDVLGDPEIMRQIRESSRSFRSRRRSCSIGDVFADPLPMARKRLPRR